MAGFGELPGRRTREIRAGSEQGSATSFPFPAWPAHRAVPGLYPFIRNRWSSNKFLLSPVSHAGKSLRPQEGVPGPGPAAGTWARDRVRVEVTCRTPRGGTALRGCAGPPPRPPHPRSWNWVVINSNDQRTRLPSDLPQTSVQPAVWERKLQTPGAHTSHVGAA